MSSKLRGSQGLSARVVGIEDSRADEAIAVALGRPTPRLPLNCPEKSQQIPRPLRKQYICLEKERSAFDAAAPALEASD